MLEWRRDTTIADVQTTVNGITHDRSPTVGDSSRDPDDVKGQIDHKNWQNH